MYPLATLCKYLTQTGFEFVGAYKDFEFGTADDSSERLYIVARCKK